MVKLIVSLDKLTPEEVKSIIQEISSSLPEYKNDIMYKFNDLIALIGFTGIYNLVKDFDIRLMLDPKWNDIPNTITNYMTQLNRSGLGEMVDVLTIHANAGSQTLNAALEVKKKLQLHTEILAITALTSQDEEDTQNIYDETSKASVLKLTKLALDAWIDGVVCSGQETQLLREVYWKNFKILNPGVRFAGGELHDQKRVITPEEAVERWVNYLVMGRPILEADNMVSAVRQFFTETKWRDYISKNSYNFEKTLYTWDWKDILSYIGAFYFRPEGGKYCRLASGLISNAYINIGTTERSYLVVEKAASELAGKVRNAWIVADIVMGAQMWSVRSSLYLAEKLWVNQSVYTEKSWNDNEQMKLKRHEINLTGKRVVISEDIVTKGSTLRKMKSMVEDAGWEVAAICCVWNRHGKDIFDGVPLISCYIPEQFELYWDENTPEEQRKDYPELPKNSQVSPKPKNEWDELVESMRV